MVDIFWRASLVVAAFVAVHLGGSALAYGGEDLLQGDPWHHENITYRALVGDYPCRPSTAAQDPAAPSAPAAPSGDRARPGLQLPGGLDKAPAFRLPGPVSQEQAEQLSDIEPAPYQCPGFEISLEAAKAIAWNADYIDSYLYSPIWWAAPAKGGRALKALDRYKAGMANYWHLASLHFDDLTSIQDIEAAHKRYTAGALAGLLWAADQSGPDDQGGKSTGDVMAAYNILGLSLHAIQDFYSHSTWINAPARRRSTYFETAPSTRRDLTLETGAYEAVGHRLQHGKYSFSCSLLQNERSPLKATLKTVCSDFFPTSTMSFCERFRECDQRESTQAIVELAGLSGDIVVLQPPGIAMDTTWLSRIGAHQRGLTEEGGVAREADFSGSISRAGQLGGILGPLDMGARDSADAPAAPGPFDTRSVNPRERCADIIAFKGGKSCNRESDYLFAEGKHLAIMASRQWMRMIDQYMRKESPAFWEKVKACRGCSWEDDFDFSSPPSHLTRPFENYQEFPFQFLSAGHNERVADPRQQGWYLRVEIDTADTRGAGTDADIYAAASAERNRAGRWAMQDGFLLDYLAVRDPDSQVRSTLLTYNDFERNDAQVYTIGPFAELPASIDLVNDASSSAERREALRHAIRDKFKGMWEGARHTLRNDQDYVGFSDWTPTRGELDAIIAGPRHIADGRLAGMNMPAGEHWLIVDGGDEGVYRFIFDVAATRWRGEGDYRDWREYEIVLREGRVLRESDVDGATRSDEPFLFASLSTYGVSETENVRFGPYENIGTDRRDTKTMAINHGFRAVRLPNGGVVTAAIEMWESDKERARDRTALFQEFAEGVSDEERDDYREYLYELGREIAAEWEVDGVRIWAFNYADQPAFGLVHDSTDERRVVGEDRKITLALDRANARSINASVSNLAVGNGLGMVTMQPARPRKQSSPAKTLTAPVRKD